MKSLMHLIFLHALITGVVSYAQQKAPAFNVPGLAGPYYSYRSVLGPVSFGTDIIVGFYLDGRNETEPIILWHKKDSNSLVEIESISAINRILEAVDEPPIASENSGIRICRQLVQKRVSPSEVTGIPLSMDYAQDLRKMVDRMVSGGLPQDKAKMILEYGTAGEIVLDEAKGIWHVSWHEIDKQGGIQQVQISGSMHPIRLKRVLKEQVEIGGTIPTKFLKWEYYTDPAKSR